jgi:hypothetical protein
MFRVIRERVVAVGPASKEEQFTQQRKSPISIRP